MPHRRLLCGVAGPRHCGELKQAVRSGPTFEYCQSALCRMPNLKAGAWLTAGIPVLYLVFTVPKSEKDGGLVPWPGCC